MIEGVISGREGRVFQRNKVSRITTRYAIPRMLSSFMCSPIHFARLPAMDTVRYAPHAHKTWLKEGLALIICELQY